MTTHAFAPSFDLVNPFMPQAREAVAVAVDTGEPTFALVQNGPPVAAEEVESAHLDAVEVTVRWGSQILAVSHLDKGKSFWVGSGSELALPEELLGAERAPLVFSRGELVSVIVPRDARGTVSRKGAGAESIVDLIARGMLGNSTELDGAHEIALGAGMTVVLELGSTTDPITVEVVTVRAGKVLPIGFLAALATGATGFVGLSFLGHAAIVASLAMFMPKMGTDDAEGIDRDQLLMMQKLLTASAEREPEQMKEMTGASEEPSGGGSTGQAHKGESGAAGTTKPVTTNGHMGFKGKDNESAVSRREELALAKEFGMAGLLAGAAVRDPNAPTSPWGQDQYKGSDEKSALGKMFGAGIDDAMGMGGLGLTGTGEGGGGSGEGIGLDHVGTVGGGGGGPGKWGIGRSDKDGIGNGHAPGGGGHVAKAPVMRNPTVSTNGRLPPEVIQRIVRQNFGRFRLCYEAGLRQNPSLSGRVSTSFVIARDGSVSQSQDSGSDLPDQNVVSCIVRSFQNLSFPAPEGGIATVTYPIVLAPGE
ncbi:putative abductin-like protein [Labilithrix luteola]|uniref:Putative abductin-like protein n=1 Tax=Labilithrix luteola TaxID=1391654 RepID=A0A0K1PU73_9BACT|nr:AgmX/PglI C-terminal domain-containing protein [Labilithrix luteola]AKU96916.1 putative abductin-like protein [Labilithrix luteola]